MVDVHPFEPFVPFNATTLIVGSIPPARFCAPPRSLCETDVDFYYGSKNNAFWKLVGEAAGRTFMRTNTPDAVMQRKQALTAMGMGITDIVAKCRRKNGSALDSQLDVIETKPIGALLDGCPQINTLLYTSTFVKSWVGRVLEQYHRSTSTPREWVIPYKGRQLKAVVLYSPSPNALRGMGAVGKDKRMQQYCRYFSIR